jgi:hypothetical protein
MCRCVGPVGNPSRRAVPRNARRRVSRFSSKTLKISFRRKRLAVQPFDLGFGAFKAHQKKVQSELDHATSLRSKQPRISDPLDMAPTRAEVALVQLKNCLVNLPSSLVSVLSNANTVRHTGLHVPRVWRPSGLSLTCSRLPKMSLWSYSIGLRPWLLEPCQALAFKSPFSWDGQACPANQR